MKLINPIRRRQQSQAGFTLIELLIVVFLLVILVLVLLLAILPAFANSKTKATNSAMVTIGDGLIALQSENPNAYFAMTRDMPDTFSSEATSIFGLSNKPGDRSDQQLARMLVFVTTPSDEALSISAKDGGEAARINVMSVDTVKQYRRVDHEWGDETYPVYVDGWDNPILFEIDLEHLSENDYPTIRLMSAGEDGDYDTTEDNIYWDTAMRKPWTNLNARDN